MMENVQTRISRADLLQRGEAWGEVVSGQWMEIDTMAAGLLHNIVIENLKDILKPYVRANGLGVVLGDGLTYILREDAFGIETTRLPDLSFLRRGRITPQADLTKPFSGAPDLAVEVTSPGQTVDTLQARIDDYLSSGSEQVWVIYVASRTVYQYTGPRTVTIYRDDDTLTADTLFPGLKIPVAALFDVGDLHLDDDHE